MQPEQIVGIIGAGRIGKTMAQIASRAGRWVVITNRHGPESLASVVEELGDRVSAGTVEEAAGADLVVLAVMWPDVPKAVTGLDWEGRILIDPTNDFNPSDLNGRTSSEVVADLVTPARVVKTANILGAGLLASDPHEAGGQRVMFLSGDDADASVKLKTGGRICDVAPTMLELLGIAKPAAMTGHSLFDRSR